MRAAHSLIKTVEPFRIYFAFAFRAGPSTRIVNTVRQQLITIHKLPNQYWRKKEKIVSFNGSDGAD